MIKIRLAGKVVIPAYHYDKSTGKHIRSILIKSWLSFVYWYQRCKQQYPQLKLVRIVPKYIGNQQLITIQY